MIFYESFTLRGNNVRLIPADSVSSLPSSCNLLSSLQTKQVVIGKSFVIIKMFSTLEPLRSSKSDSHPLLLTFHFYLPSPTLLIYKFLSGDTIPHVLTWLFPSLMGSFLTSRQFVITVCTLAISYPLSLYRNIESLSKASAIALFSMVLIIVTVIVRGPAMPAELKGDPSLRVSKSHICSRFSVSLLSF